MTSNPLALEGAAMRPTHTILARQDTFVTVLSTIQDTGPTAAPANGGTASKAVIGPVVGGLIGGIAAGLLLALFILWNIRRRKQKKEEARVVLARRRARQLAHHRSRRSTSTMGTMGSGQALTSPTEKGYNPNIAVPPPKRPSKSYEVSPQQYDPFMSEKAYGFEPQPMAYVPAGGEYYIQQAYDLPSVQPQMVPIKDASEDHVVPDTDSGKQSRRASRGATRMAAADTAAASASAPREKRHRPAKPSPLARSAEQMPSNGMFGGPQPGPSLSGSASSSIDGFHRTSPSSSESSHAAYAAAANGSWGIALGSPEHDSISFGAQQDRALAETRAALHSAESDIRTRSGVYSHDPFAEYHEYMTRPVDEEQLVDAPTQKPDWI